MKKLLLLLPLVAGGSWAGASYYTGAQTQQAYDQLLTQLNELMPVSLVNEQYNAGVAKSTAITLVKDSAAPDADVLFRLHHVIQHSPVGLNEGAVRVGAAHIKTTLQIDDPFSDDVQAILQGFGGLEPIQLNTVVNFDHSMVNQLIVNRFEHQRDDTGFRFDGMDYTLTVEGNRFSGSGGTGEVVVSSEDGFLKLTPGTISSDLTRVSSGIFTGDYSVSFDKLTLSGPQIPVSFALKSMQVSGTSSIQDARMDSSGRLAIGSIDSPLPLNSAAMDISTFAIPFEGLERYMQVIGELSAGDSQALENPEVLDDLMSAMQGLAGPGTGLSVDLSFSNEGGNGTLDSTVKLVEASSPYYPADGVGSLATLRDVLNALQFEFNLNADAQAVDMTPLAMFANMPEAQQFILADGVSYTSAVSVRDLLVDINGNPLSLEIMLGEALDMPLESAMAMMP